MIWAGHVARMGERRDTWRVFVGKHERKRPLGRPRHRWEDNIKMDIQEVGCGGTDWIQLSQDRDRWRALVNAVMDLRVPWNAGNFLTCWKPVSFSRRTLLHGVSKYIILVNDTSLNNKTRDNETVTSLPTGPSFCHTWIYKPRSCRNQQSYVSCREIESR